MVPLALQNDPLAQSQEEAMNTVRESQIAYK